MIAAEADLHLFRHLASLRRTVLTYRDLLPHWKIQTTANRFGAERRIWWTWRHGPIAGWQVQQIIKMAAAEWAKEEALLYCDSDMFFVRGVDLNGFWRGPNLRMLRSSEAGVPEGPPHSDFVTTSLAALKISPVPEKTHGYIDNAVTWHGSLVKQMLNHVTETHGRHWCEYLSKPAGISEYTLYGYFADYVAGEAAPVFHDSQSLCKTRWNKDDSETVAAFCSKLDPGHVALAFQSFLDADQATLNRVFEASV
ncbi:MAG: hypothetical protein KGO53_15170 [Alphaproteobacteria bacterium]|nr:hypothetical protein [Alphaproteobacteria bacterium]